MLQNNAFQTSGFLSKKGRLVNTILNHLHKKVESEFFLFEFLIIFSITSSRERRDICIKRERTMFTFLFHVKSYQDIKEMYV